MKRIQHILPYLFPFVAAIFYIIVYLHATLDFSVGSDTKAQLEQITTGVFTNWWSPLILGEGRGLYLLLVSWCGQDFSLDWIFRIFGILATIIMFSSVAALSWRFGKIKEKCEWLSIPLTLVVICLVFVRLFSAEYLFRLDIMGGACAFGAVTIPLVFCPSKKWKQMVCCIGTMLLLLHACEMRASLVLLFPFISYLLVYCVFRQGIARSVIYAIVLSAVVLPAVKYCSAQLVDEGSREYPVQVMLQSDLKIAAILEEDESLINEELYMVPFPSVENDEGDHYHRIAATMFSLHHASSEQEWKRLLSMYCRYWREHPLAMVESRVIQSVQFCTGNYTPNFLRYLVRLSHPHMIITGRDKNGYFWPINRIIWPHYIIAFLFWICGAWLPIRQCLHAGKPVDRNSVTGLVLACICLVSLACYLVVVPTSCYRYRVPTVLLGAVSLSWWWVTMRITGQRSNKREANEREL